MSTVEFIHDHFFLRDGVVHRKSNGKPVTTKRNPEGRKTYPQTCVLLGGKRVVIRLHRIRFALEHGYLPPIVDHKNRNTKDYSSGNLRPADKRLNSVNTPRRGRLPKGVRQHRSKFYAYCTRDGKQVHLGVYATEEEAARVAAEERRKMYGEFYHG